jgi:hypothetical protein
MSAKPRSKDPEPETQEETPGEQSVQGGESSVEHAEKLAKDVPKASTLPAGASVQTKHAQPVRVDGRTRRTDADGLEGGRVKVTGGEFEGREGVFTTVAQYDPDTGYPKVIIVRTADGVDAGELLTVPYDDVEAITPRGGRA